MIGTALAVGDRFKEFLDNLRTTNDATIAARRGYITRRLNVDFWDTESPTSHTRYVGSYGRGTDIAGLSDVDLLAELPAAVYRRFDGHAGNGQSALLQAVRASLLRTYSKTDTGGDGQVVVVRFDDGVTFEILPAFPAKDGGYLHPDANDGGKWRLTNPVAEIDAINEANKRYNKKIKHLARMVRAWKRKHAVPMKGLLIDTLAYNFVANWEYNDKSFFYYDWMVRDFFRYLTELDPSQGHWRAPGSRQYVYRSGKFEQRAAEAYENAAKACECELAQKTGSANERWRKIFGSSFTG